MFNKSVAYFESELRLLILIILLILHNEWGSMHNNDRHPLSILLILVILPFPFNLIIKVLYWSNFSVRKKIKLLFLDEYNYIMNKINFKYVIFLYYLIIIGYTISLGFNPLCIL